MAKRGPKPYVYRVATHIEIGDPDKDAAKAWFEAQPPGLFDCDRMVPGLPQNKWFYSLKEANDRADELLSNEWQSCEDLAHSPMHPLSVYVAIYGNPKVVIQEKIKYLHEPDHAGYGGKHPDGNTRLLLKNVMTVRTNKFDTVKPNDKKTKKERIADEMAGGSELQPPIKQQKPGN